MRIQCDVAELTLDNGQAQLGVRVDLRGLNDASIVLDVSTYGRYVHAGHHLGSWCVRPTGQQASFDVFVDLRTIDEGSIRFGNCIEDSLDIGEPWVNSEYQLTPVQDIQVILRDGLANVVEIQHIALRVMDPTVLEAYANAVHEEQGYTPGDDFLAFVHAFHFYKLRTLARLFERFVPSGGIALDVGCGRSQFTEVLEQKYRTSWPFRLVCCDIASKLMLERRNEFPQYQWLASDAGLVPFKSSAFDLVFAGELIEHVVDAKPLLEHWRQALKPGGILILTTPNRKRLPNAVNRSDEPMGADHISELTYGECRILLRDAGFEILSTEGIYLQLALNWWSLRGPKVDLMPRPFTRAWQPFVMDLLLRLGGIIPHYAFDIVYVARKTTASSSI